MLQSTFTRLWHNMCIVLCFMKSTKTNEDGAAYFVI